jgi:hypothetical protein
MDPPPGAGTSGVSACVHFEEGACPIDLPPAGPVGRLLDDEGVRNPFDLVVAEEELALRDFATEDAVVESVTLVKVAAGVSVGAVALSCAIAVAKVGAGSTFFNILALVIDALAIGAREDVVLVRRMELDFPKVVFPNGIERFQSVYGLVFFGTQAESCVEIEEYADVKSFEAAPEVVIVASLCDFCEITFLEQSFSKHKSMRDKSLDP